MLNPFKNIRVSLSPESIKFARWEGKELFENSRRLRTGDTVETKIRNCMIGAYGQQVLVDKVKAHRVSKEECPNFAYDVLCDHEALAEWSGYRDPSITSKVVRVEIKTHLMENGRGDWITFYDDNLKHALSCARARQYDYMAFFAVSNCNWTEGKCSGDVSFLGLIPAHTVASNAYWSRSRFNENQVYLLHRDVNTAKAGKIYLG